MQNNHFNSLTFGKFKISTYNPGGDSIFAVSSSIISGENEAVLIDAQFQKNDSEALVAKIKEEGKKLSTIFISNADPDFYFGLDTILKNFPEAKILSVPQIIYLINASKDEKMKVWKDALGENAPEKIIIPEVIQTNFIELEGLKIEIKQDPKDSDHIYLWIPEFKIVLGGVSITTDSHIWLADSQECGDLERWSKKIDEIKSLNPEKIIPGHSLYKDDKFTDIIGLDEVKTYLTQALSTKESAKTSAEFISIMKEYYPAYTELSSLEMSAKVLTKEIPWETLHSYPGISKKINVKFGELAYELNFKDYKSMTFVGLTEATKNDTDTVEYTAVEIAYNIFMLYWEEPHLKARVVHVQDFNKNIVYTNISAPNGDFYNLKGSLEIK